MTGTSEERLKDKLMKLQRGRETSVAGSMKL